MSEVLGGLGFKESDYDKLCSEFSGGWQMRIGLARLLLSEPDILLLDEPTNHLDTSARNWVANFIKKYQNTVVLVSHDEVTPPPPPTTHHPPSHPHTTHHLPSHPPTQELLRTGVDSIAEVTGGGLSTYKTTSYDKYLLEREERAKRLITAYTRQIEEASTLQAFIDKWGASATKATQAKDREKKLEKLKKEMGPPPPGYVPPKGGSGQMLGVARAVGAEATAGGGEKKSVGRGPSLTLPKPPPCGQYPVELKGSTFGWAEGAPPIIRQVSGRATTSYYFILLPVSPARV